MPTGFITRFILLSLLMAGHSLCAQWRPQRLHHLGAEEGFKHWTFDMAQDSAGYMYFGTEMGLVRYDGHSIELFAHDPNDPKSIGPGDVWCMVYGSDDKIWMGSRISGLNVFDPKEKKFERFATPNSSVLAYDAVLSVMEDPEGSIWVGGAGFRLSRFDRKSKTWETFTPEWSGIEPGNSRFPVQSIFQDRFNPDLIWFGVGGYPVEGMTFNRVTALVSFDKKTKQFERHPCSGRPRYQADDGSLWLIAQGIHIYQPRTKTFVHNPLIIPYFNGPLSPLVRDLAFHENEIFAAVPFAILGDVTLDNYTLLSNDPEYGITESVFIDAQHNVWFGRNRGITVLGAEKEAIRYYSLQALGVSDRIYPSRYVYNPTTQSVWIINHAIGYDGKTIYEIPLDPRKSTSSTMLDFPVSGLTIDSTGHMWMAGNGRFYSPSATHISSAFHEVELPCSNDIIIPWYITTSPEGWIGGTSRNQFVWFSPDKQTCFTLDRKDLPQETDAPPSIGFTGMHWRSNQKAFLYSNYVYDVDLSTASVRKLPFQQGIKARLQEDINSVVEDTRGHVWITTLSMIGEFVVHNDSLILARQYSTSDGLGSSWAHELYADDSGRIWIFASNGISAIQPATGEIRNFGVHEGLQEPYIDPWYLLKTEDGHLISTNAKGFIVYHPDSLWNAYSTRDVPVVLKQIRIAGNPIDVGGDMNYLTQLDLKVHQNYVDIQFQALVYPTDYNITYSYIVEGLHDQWISIGENKIVTLSSLSPGSYTLRVKAGPPASEAPEKVLHIHMATPLIQQTWFIILMSVVMMSITYGAYRWRIQTIRQQEEEKSNITKQIAELELKALRSQMNPHFMFNSLNSIKNYILHAEPKLAAEYLSSFAHLIRMILQNSREKMITLQEELETLILYIELEQIRFDHQFEFHCIIDDDLRLEQIMIPPMLLQPYVENAIWHGLMHKKEKGNLFLRFAKEGEMVACIIEDDGVGRSKAAEMKSLSANKYKSMGMGITRDRIEIMNKMDTLGITTEVIDQHDSDGRPAGTKIIVRIPGPSIT
jgi:hypothetical protein